jgi:hypothetical protein
MYLLLPLTENPEPNAFFSVIAGALLIGSFFLTAKLMQRLTEKAKNRRMNQ